MPRVQSYRDLIVWQKSVELVLEIYRATQNFPKAETYGLVSQLRRAAVSVPSNVAEGHARLSTGEYKQFLAGCGKSRFTASMQRHYWIRLRPECMTYPKLSCACILRAGSWRSCSSVA
ncbi:MAG: four helix bundle protein, partial [Candidatus Sulfotelmatobacter sp.]